MTDSMQTTYEQAAAEILAALQGYEDAHPTGEPCFRFALEECEKRYAQVYGGDVA